MAEQYAKQSQYQYAANSNLVLDQDRSRIPRRDNEPTGEPETLAGRINPKEMGTRVQREKLPVTEEKKRRAQEKRDIEQARRRNRKEETRGVGNNYSSVITATEDLEGLIYTPRTKDTRDAYELILSFVHDYLPDQSHDTIRSAADAVLETLKTDSMKDFDKKTAVDDLFSQKLTSERFAQLISLSKKITDYGQQKDGGTTGDRADAIDDELGMAVVFEDEDEEDEIGAGFGDDGDVDYEVYGSDQEDEETEEEEEKEEAASYSNGKQGQEGTTIDATNLLGTDRSAANTTGEEADESTETGVEDDAGFRTVLHPDMVTRSKRTRRLGAAAGARQRNQAVVNTDTAVGIRSSHRQELDFAARDIDAFWLQRLVGSHYTDPLIAQEKSNHAMQLLSDDALTTRDRENELMQLFDYDKFELVQVLTRNRDLIVWCTRLARAGTDGPERQTVETEMRQRGLDWILRALQGEQTTEDMNGSSAMDVDKTAAAEAAAAPAEAPKAEGTAPQRQLDLEALTFQRGGHLMSNKQCKLPEGSFKRLKKGYEEIHVPALKAKPMASDERLIPIEELPNWAQIAFKNAEKLNRIQSRVFPIAFGADDNMLLCAPTGAGKTNCAMLAMLREISHHRDPDTGTIDLTAFKIVYVAPMKALVQEMVGNFGNRLAPFGIQVAELTGDRQLTKQQIADTQVIVTTPEKWDIITRKANDRSYTNLVRLVIIDEIHLLHDDRGPVLESLAARILRGVEQTRQPVRLIGLSATLPNYADVAAFLRVDPDRGLFHFDSSYRPCPLKQEYVAITERKAIKRYQMMNEVTYEKVMEYAGKHQVLIFTHSRKETARTAKWIRDTAIERDTIGQFLRQDSAVREILQSEAATAKDANLQDLLPYGFAIHHAGMTRVDRTLVEDLFDGGHVQVLISTATLAWGVNLPAHTVIIKGTQIYSPEKGRWVELSPQDVLQMLGRAGRPQHDTYGEGIIITSQQEVQFYLSLLNQQLPIESQLVSRLADSLNAEIVMGTVRHRDEAVQWLGYTYLYIRMLRNGALYGISPEEAASDPYLEQRRVDLIHAAAAQLDRSQLVRYDRKTGKLQTTELGRIAAHYYISHESMANYNQHLRPQTSQMELFRIFALSEEFRYIPVREEEKLELSKLLERVPVPVKEGVEEPTAKVNVLLQAYISRLKLEGFALVADMVYITQSAGRLLRALFEICLRRGWAQLARRALDICKMVEKRQWLSMSPLRQFKHLPSELIRKLERKEFPWERMQDLTIEELEQLINVPRAGRTLHRAIHQLPRLELQAHVQPVTRSLLRVELTITPDFQWDEKIHGTAEAFWILAEDADGEIILYQDIFLLKQHYAEEDHTVTFTVPLFEPMPPNYFISLVSDRWLRSESRLPVSFKRLILPEKYAPHTELLDLQPLPVAALRDPTYEAIYADWVNHFNPVQTQTFNALHGTDANILIGAAAGSGKTVAAEFALLRLWKRNGGRCVYVAPVQAVVDARVREWRRRFARLDKQVVALTGETTADLKLLEQGDIIGCTPEQWDIISRRWRQRKLVQTVGLFLADEIHLMGGDRAGPTYEVIVSRMRYIAAQTGQPIRIVALGASMANARDIAEWIGASTQHTFNFHPMVRPVPLEVHLQSYAVSHFASLMLAMTRPVYQAILQSASTNRPTLVFVPSRKQCRLTAADLLMYAAADEEPDRFLGCEHDELKVHLAQVTDATLAGTLQHGIGYYHEALSDKDKRIVEQLYTAGALQVLVASKDTCWGMSLAAYLVIVMGTQSYLGREHRYVDYPMADVLQMMGRACRTGQDMGRCILMCQTAKKEFYKKFLHEALPIESHLDHFLHDHFNAEIVTRTIESKQDAVDWLTWTFLYRRMTRNPNYYGLQGVTHRHLSDHLSELVETTLNDLVTARCISVEEEDDEEITPLNLGMIAAYYNIHYATVEMFGASLKATSKLRGLLEIISAASEFESLPLRHHEVTVLQRLQDRLPVKLTAKRLDTPASKANLLLQAHFSRLELPADLAGDQRLILERVTPLLQACVDVISSQGWLAPALAAMELSQMCVQAQWDTESPLRQLPYFTQDHVKRCEQAGIELIFDVAELSDKKRNTLLQLNADQMRSVARFVNRYPSIEMEYQLDLGQDEEKKSGRTRVGQPGHCIIQLNREMDDEDATTVGPVIAPFFPKTKDEGWWLVMGDPSDQTLVAIKRVTLQRSLTVRLEFTPHRAGPLAYKLYFICDAYLGCDQEYDIELIADEALEETSSEEEEEEEEEDTEMKDVDE